MNFIDEPIVEIEEQQNAESPFPNKAEILPVSSFLSITNLRIPEYQRPYKWDEHNIAQLINDIFTHRAKSNYRLGTIVIHQNVIKNEEHPNGKLFLDIVDGQQRFTTLRIILYALYEIIRSSNTFEPATLSEVQKLKDLVEKIPLHYASKSSVLQINKNYNDALRLLRKYDDKAVRAFINGCQLVVFYITDITEAFQFFDSQNARGKDLYPHDLLKAFHLREFDHNEADMQIKVVQAWEDYSSKELSKVFAEYLFRIKGWSGKQSSRQFTKHHIKMFKGINISKTEQFPYVKTLQIAHSFVDHYNGSFERNIDNQKFSYPFQLDSIMINGRRFFEYVAHYKGIVKDFKQKYNAQDLPVETELANKTTYMLFRLVYANNKSYRDGEKYLKALFECLIIYYVDKFGYAEFDSFVEKAFVWCYSLRFIYQRLGFDSVDNYVLNNNLFNKIKEAILPSDVLRYNIRLLPTQQDVLKYCSDPKRMDNKIAEFFKVKMYYAD